MGPSQLSWVLMRVLIPLLFLFARPSAADTTPTVYRDTVKLVEELYLEPAGVSEGSLLEGAAERLGNELHWLVVESSGSEVTLSHGDGSAVGLVSVGSLETLPAALYDLEGVVKGAGHDLGKVDVRLEILRGLTDALDRS